MSNAAFVKSDLSLVRLVGEGTDAAWKAPLAEQTETDSARPLLQRADEAAAWTAAQPAVRRRLTAAVIDVDDSLCAWVKAPSDARPVLSAALRSLMQEWGDDRLADSVEPITEHERPDGAAERSPLLRLARRLTRWGQGPEAEAPAEPLEPIYRGVSVPVIAIPDALVRLWLDALDRRAVRVARVMTLWHALASAWNRAPDDLVSAILIIEEDRLTWAWARGAALLAGGGVEADRPRAPQEDDSEPASSPEENPRPGACKRLALDWLTWSSQLGFTPDRVVIVGAACRAWAQTLAEHWAPIDAECVEEPAPIGATLLRLATAPPDAAPISSRRALETLTRRPTRALRARYRLAGAAMLFLLVAVSSVAFRLREKAGEWRAQASAIRDESVALVREGFPALATARITDPGKVAQTEVQRLMAIEPPQMPPTPRPIPQELARVAAILADPSFDGAVRLRNFQLDQAPNGNQLQYEVPDRQVAADIFRRLSAPDRLVDWEARRGVASGDPLRPTLQGDWILTTN